ncbi:MAG: hypothetical protein IJ747_04460 [Lachnospiraceae bacterium]|nr:hypothetical protein [Lachnospiraceae bacterium]
MTQSKNQRQTTKADAAAPAIQKRLPMGRLFWTALFIIGLLVIWKTQRAVPIMMDDEWYATVLSSETPLSSLQDIVQAQIWHYQNWGGRTVAHTIDQLILLYLSEPVSDLLNVAVILLLSWMLNAIMGIRRDRLFAFTTLTIGLLHGLNANWKMSMYWQTGACNYLYTTVLILAFLWMYLDALELPEQRKHPAVRTGKAQGQPAGSVTEANKGVGLLFLILAPVLGLLCGWTNENMGPAVFLLTVLIMYLFWKEHHSLPLWMPLGSLFSLAGSILMIVAPGNGVRSAEIASNNYGTLWQLFLRMYGICKGAWEYLFPVITVTAAALLINLCILKNRLHKKEVLLLIGALLSWGAMVLSPHYPDRASFGTMCLLLCVLLSQAEDIADALPDPRHRLFLAGIGTFLWLRGMYYLGEFLAICWGWIR